MPDRQPVDLIDTGMGAIGCIFGIAEAQRIILFDEERRQGAVLALADRTIGQLPHRQLERARKAAPTCRRLDKQIIERNRNRRMTRRGMVNPGSKKIGSPQQLAAD